MFSAWEKTVQEKQNTWIHLVLNCKEKVTWTLYPNHTTMYKEWKQRKADRKTPI
jgi:hypothetical protein